MSLSILPDVPLGTRVVVRYLIEEGARATDALGVLIARDETTLTVETRRGPVEVEQAEVVIAKVVPPTPTAWRLASFMKRGRVCVFDLDGVLRVFDTSGELALAERNLGLPKGELLTTAFLIPEALRMVTGSLRFGEWIEAVRAQLLLQGLDAHGVDHALEVLVADRGTVVEPTAALIEELIAADTPVFIFTNGTDRVPEELRSLGLGHLLPGLLNAHDLGFAKPAPEAYEIAHAAIEERLGRRVGLAEIHFTDDRPGNVDAARRFGWQARVFTMPMHSRG